MTLWDVAREERRRRRGEVGRHEKRKSIGLEFQDKYNTNRIKIRLENRKEQECMKIDIAVHWMNNCEFSQEGNEW